MNAGSGESGYSECGVRRERDIVNVGSNLGYSTASVVTVGQEVYYWQDHQVKKNMEKK
ncbi:unnamed protein product, partial [Staurois parvus]